MFHKYNDLFDYKGTIRVETRLDKAREVSRRYNHNRQHLHLFIRSEHHKSQQPSLPAIEHITCLLLVNSNHNYSDKTTETKEVRSSCQQQEATTLDTIPFPSSNTMPTTTDDFVCELCTEATSRMVTFANCGHHACHDCVWRWIVHNESAGQAVVQCPFCRVVLIETDMSQILGRPYQPQSGGNYIATDDSPMDGLTRQWLQSHTRQCGNCGNRIEKHDGCDLMECLCGYRFCFECGRQGGDCHCTPEHHVFWDNVCHRNSSRDHQPVVVSVESMNTGLWLQRRKERENKRMEREASRSVKATELSEMSHVELLAAIYSGSGWLFRRRPTMCLNYMYKAITAHARKGYERKQRKRFCDADDPLYNILSPVRGIWLFETSHSETMLADLVLLANKQSLRKRQRQSRRTEIRNTWNIHFSAKSQPCSALGRDWLYKFQTVGLSCYHLNKTLRLEVAMARRLRRL